MEGRGVPPTIAKGCDMNMVDQYLAEDTNCWVDGSDGVPCAKPRAGIYGVELVLWLNDDGSPVKGVQSTPLCAEHHAQAQRDGVVAA